MRKFDRENAIVICTIVLCIMLTLGICYFLSGEGFLSTFKDKEQGQTIFAVASGGYSDITLARTNAELIKQRGGAGYTLNEDGIICIIVAVYPDSDTANRVLTNLGDSSAYIKPIELAAGEMDWCKKDNQSAVEGALSYFDKAFDALYTLSNSLNDNSASLDDAKTQIKVLRAQIEEIKSDFYQNIANYDESQITEIKLALVTTLALIDNADTTSNVVRAVSSIRYQLVQLVLCRQALMKSL